MSNRACVFLVGVLALPVVAEVNSQRQGELLYLLQQDCGSCHGMRLKGGLGPALLPQSLSAKSDELLVNTILHGREGTAMPPWLPMLSEPEAVWLVEQLRQGVADAP